VKGMIKIMKSRFKGIKAFSALCSAFIMISALIGCGSDTNSIIAAATGGEAATTEKAATAGVIHYEKQIKFTMSVIDAEKAGKNEDDTPAANLEWLKKKFNIDLEFVGLTWGDYVDKTRIWIASADGPDLMMLDIAPVRYSEFTNWVKNGLIKAYPNLSKYPNLQQKMNNMKTGKKFIIDNKLYAWPAYVDMQQYNYVTNNAFLYRKDWAEKVGLNKEDGIYTLDEWCKLVKAVITKDPNGNGAGKTIGMLGSDWLFPKYFGTGAISPNLLSYVKGEDGKWVWGPMLPESLKAVRVTKKMYDEGLIWKDQSLVKAEDSENKFDSGLAFAPIGPSISASSLYSAAINFEKANPTLKAEKVFGIAHITGPDGKILSYQAPDQWSQTALNQNMSDEKIDRWCQVLDYLVSDEGYYFRTLGIKGVDWVLEDGKPVAKWQKDENGTFKNPYANGTWNWARAASCMDGFVTISPQYPQWMKDAAVSGLKLSMSSETNLIEINPDLAYFSAPNYDKVGTEETEIYQEIANLMSTKMDVTQAWKEWVKSKMEAIQPVLDELNASLK
jgi:putative aldouronate transport system substrate-binding protein